MNFDKYVQSCNHHLHQDTECCYHQNKCPCAPWWSGPSLSLAPGHLHLLSVSPFHFEEQSSILWRYGTGKIIETSFYQFGKNGFVLV